MSLKKTKSYDKLIFRKLYRLAALIFPLFYYLTSRQTTLILIVCILSLYIIVEILRFRFSVFNERLFAFFKAILKDKEKNRISASTYLLASIFLTVLFFNKTIAIFAIVFAVLGDATANIIGQKFGHIRLGEKSLEGSVAFFVVCVIAGFFLTLTYLDMNIYLILLGSFAATVTELVSSKIDDNLTVPFVTAFLISCASRFLTFA